MTAFNVWLQTRNPRGCTRACIGRLCAFNPACGAKLDCLANEHLGTFSGDPDSLLAVPRCVVQRAVGGHLEMSLELELHPLIFGEVGHWQVWPC